MSATRYFSVSISSQLAEMSRSNSSFPKGSKVIIWNARSAHRPSFAENVSTLFDYYSPMVVVVTEARVSKPYINYVRKQLKSHYLVEIIGPNNGLGGLLVVWDNRALPYFLHKQSTLYGHVLCTTIKPGWITTAEAGGLPEVAKSLYESEDDGYEYF